MILLSRAVRVYFATAPVDLRRSFDGLKRCPEIGQLFSSRAKGSAAGGVKSASSLRGRGAGSGPPFRNVQDVAICGHVLNAAIDRAAAEAELRRPSFAVLTHDMTGSAREVEELAWAKTASAFVASPGLETVSPYVSTRDAGAAMGVLALATSALLVHKAPSSALGVCCLSAAGQRGAAILRPAGVG